MTLPLPVSRLRAKKSGAIISYDPNYRASLWKNKNQAMKEMRSLLPITDMIKISSEEMGLLTGEEELDKAAGKLHDQGITLVVITLGADGAYVSLKRCNTMVAGFECRPIDTTGAGDTFWGGFLSKFLSEQKKLSQVSLEDAAEYARYGNAAASLCVERRGAIPAIPSKLDVEQRIKNIQNSK